MGTGIVTAHHLDANEQIALHSFLDRLRRQYSDQVEHVILFGSKVRGDFDKESDIDLLIVVDSDDWRLRDRIVDLTLEPLLEHSVLLSTKVIDQGYYAFIARRRTPFYLNVHEDGVELWTKAL